MARTKKKDADVEEVKDVKAEVPQETRVFSWWNPNPDDLYFVRDNNCVIARYDKYLNFKHDSLCTYRIMKSHYISKLDDILIHINYFVTFYDTNKSYFVSMLRAKFMVDTNKNFSSEAFSDMIIKDIITDEFVDNIRAMTKDLYQLNIDKDTNGDYKSTPKITNEQAKVILSVSFAIRMILPICLHFEHCSAEFPRKRDYIPFFDGIFMDIITKFEDRCGVEIYAPLFNFVQYRIDRKYNTDLLMWQKKKQVHGTNKEMYLKDLTHEVIIVKALYKITYSKSVVSYFDGIITRNYMQFKSENYKSKPQEICSTDFQQSDGEDFLSHADALEMTSYRVDESSVILNATNIERVYHQLLRQYDVKITKEEFEFYKDRVKFNPLSMKILHVFYSRYFNDSTAIQLLTRDQSVMLLLILKKYLQLSGQEWLPQVCTAQLRGKYKENMIKNCKFVEKYKTSALYQEISEKFKYAREVVSEDPVITMLSTMINSQFTWVDMNEDIDGIVVDDIPMDPMITEFLEFMYLV
jgi:hypothetical protein